MVIVLSCLAAILGAIPALAVLAFYTVLGWWQCRRECARKSTVAQNGEGSEGMEHQLIRRTGHAGFFLKADQVDTA